MSIGVEVRKEQGTNIDFMVINRYADFAVPVINGHQIVVPYYKN